VKLKTFYQSKEFIAYKETQEKLKIHQSIAI